MTMQEGKESCLAKRVLLKRANTWKKYLYIRKYIYPTENGKHHETLLEGIRNTQKRNVSSISCLYVIAVENDTFL